MCDSYEELVIRLNRALRSDSEYACNCRKEVFRYFLRTTLESHEYTR